MSDVLWNIPNTWIWTEIKDLGEIVSGGTPSTKEPAYWGDEVNWISPSDLTGYNKKTIAKGAKNLTLAGLKNSSARVMPAGSVHFSSRAPIGYVAISSQSICTNQGFKSLVPSDGVFNEYAYYYLKASKYLAEERATGTTFKEISGTAFGKLPFPLPPTNEQKRIVAKIEELFSELDSGIQSLKIAREQLKVYRQAVLKHAFEGKLTAPWREKNKDKLESADQLLARIKREREEHYQQELKEYSIALKQWEKDRDAAKKPNKPNKPSAINKISDEKLAELAPLPLGWSWLQVSDLCDVVRGGSPRPAGDPQYYDGNIPFLKVADITRKAGAYLDSYTYTIKPAGLTKTRLISPKKLLLSNSGATLGVPKICLIEATFNDGIAAFLGLAEELLIYHYYFWLSKTDKLRAINQGAAQPNLNTDLIKEFFIPICFSEEMKLVAQEIESKLSVCDQLELEIEINLQKSEALRQSILKKAFSGQLVAQAPADEPASALLERIRTEKATSRPTARKLKDKKRAA
jgi:type I restriction enzyme S subunit